MAVAVIKLTSCPVGKADLGLSWEGADPREEVVFCLLDILRLEEILEPQGVHILGVSSGLEYKGVTRRGIVPVADTYSILIEFPNGKNINDISLQEYRAPVGAIWLTTRFGAGKIYSWDLLKPDDFNDFTRTFPESYFKII